FMKKLSHEKEILMNCADMIIQNYNAESALLRVEKLIGVNGESAMALQKDMAMVSLHRAVNICTEAGRDAIQSFAEGDELRVMLMGLKRFTKIEPFNVKEARRRVANAMLEAGKYCY